ncbi:hypothetical protein [Nonomuraea sp. NPDC050202]|uniref:hypothetical protein n=1 Tax=Nonomuraea sp. NPDC050202 TaxID=3155035 RepID=UPI0033F728CB
MAWARIDDAFDDHPKVLALLDMDGAAAAIGLWTLCLTYAHRNTRRAGKVPGLIPPTLPRRFFGPDGRAMAALLVEVGLWEEVDDGWMIHDFAEYLPGKEVSAARSAAGKKGAAKRWGDKKPPPDGNRMAPPKQDDGNAIASAKQPDGTLPSTDGTEITNSHDPMANDGSRAGARRDRVDVRTTVLSPVPSPEPVPPSAGATAPGGDTPPRDSPPNAGDVVAAWIEGAQAASGERPATRLISQVGRQARELLDEGKNPARLLEAATAAGRKGFADLGRELLRMGTTPGQDAGTGGRFAAGSGSRAPVPTADDIRNGQVIL